MSWKGEVAFTKVVKVDYHVCSILLTLWLELHQEELLQIITNRIEWDSRERSMKCQASQSKAFIVGTYTQTSAAVLVDGKRKEGSSLCVHRGQGLEFM